MSAKTAMQSFFGKDRKVHAASAPGRLDVMGGIADYSGSYVLQMPIRERTTVHFAERNDGVIRAHSSSARDSGPRDTVTFLLNEFSGLLKQDKIDKIRQKLRSNPANAWAAYVAGCVLCLIKEKDIPFNGGDFWVDSEVPIGKGVSSSAALEVAAMSAICKAFTIKLKGNELPVLAQVVENRYVGAPCGLMDQLATFFGKKDHLLPITCQPDQVEPPIHIPKPVSFIGIDSGERHSVGGASYSDVRTAAFMGYTIIARELGVSKKALTNAKRKHTRDGLPYSGYLAQITPSEYESRFMRLIPETISGQDFIKQFGDTIDPITTPQPGKQYAVRVCTEHPIYENHRVHSFYLLLNYLNVSGLSKPVKMECYKQLGEWMYQSHTSYGLCGLGSAATDELAQLAREMGPENGIFGARITGGGSGGTVCILCVGPQGTRAVKEIAKKHSVSQKKQTVTFTGSANGAFWNESRLTFNWEGGLSKLRDQYTSVELQKKASDLR